MNKRFPPLKIAAYAFPSLALAVVGVPIYVYIPKFYSDVVGVPVAVIGIILAAIRAFDAISDPLVGFLSDHTSTRWGRRRPYIFLFPVPLALTMYFLFHPPHLAPVPAAWWLGSTLFLLFLFWTLVTVPYESLGPELVQDYDERTILLGSRDGALIAGTLLAAVMPVILAARINADNAMDAERQRFLIMALIYAPLLIASCWICVAALRERHPDREHKPPEILRNLRTLATNRPFRILLASYTISAFGSNLPATLILYYVQHVLDSARAEMFLVMYLGAGILFLPVWIWLARRIGKKGAWLTSVALNTGAFFFVWFLGSGDEWQYGILVLLSGMGFGATLALPSTMQADVIDYHEMRTGARREGYYIGVWSIARKMAAALGVGMALTILGRAGYRPGEVQPETVRTALRFSYALVPCACNLVGFCIALFYPISKDAHRIIRETIAKNRATGSTAAG